MILAAALIAIGWRPYRFKLLLRAFPFAKSPEKFNPKADVSATGRFIAFFKHEVNLHGI